MKTNFLNYLLLLPVVLLCSCNDWLNITPKGRIVLTTTDEYGRLFDDDIQVVSSYNIEDARYLSDEEWLNAQVVVLAWSNMNLAVANYLFKTDYNRSENATGNAGSGATPYQYFYQRITKICNTILYDIETMTGSESDKTILAAQAKAMRAFNYFQLVNLYAKPYNSATADTDGAVPLRTDNFVEEIPVPAKSTVAQVYAQIQKDIDEALAGLPETALTPFRFNKAAGYALKAKVHLYKKEFDDCLAAAKEAFRLNPYMANLPSLVPVPTGTAATKPSTPIYATDKENLYFATTQTTYFLFHQDLINLFKEALTAYGEAETVTDARWSMYQQPVPAVKDYQYTAQWMPSQKEYSANSIGLRTSEVVLMMAECYARKGDYANLKACLEPYFACRYRNYVHANLVVPSNVTDAVKMVIKERRKELTQGHNRFFDLRRLNTETAYQTIPSRTVPADPAAAPSVPQATYTLPVNSPLYVLPFPSKVKDNDPRLTDNTMN